MEQKHHYSQLDYQDRETIAISLENGLSLRAIGRVLNRSASTISPPAHASRPASRRHLTLTSRMRCA